MTAQIIVSIVSAIITGGLSLIGVVLTVQNSNKQIENKLTVSQAVTDTKLDALTDEVREHNNFAKRVPLLELKSDMMSKDIESLRKEIEELKDT